MVMIKPFEQLYYICNDGPLCTASVGSPELKKKKKICSNLVLKVFWVNLKACLGLVLPNQ